MKRIGIDVGGTNTDAVFLSDGIVLDAIKRSTTADVTGGIRNVLTALIDRNPEAAGGMRSRFVLGTYAFEDDPGSASVRKDEPSQPRPPGRIRRQP